MNHQSDATPERLLPTDLPETPRGNLLHNIPEELRSLKQWVGWRKVNREGKTSKLPVNPQDGRPASSTDPQQWGTFTEAAEGMTYRKWDGVGFVFSADDPYCGIDLDDCIDSDSGEIDPDALAVLDRFATYAEYSPSGHGIHLILKGKPPEGAGRKRGDRECYDRGRFFTMTGDRITPRGVEERAAALVEWHAATFPLIEAKPAAGPSMPLELSDTETVDRIRRSVQGTKFERLWAGDESGYGSRSEADLALCSILAWWANKDAVSVDRLFRASGLMREKWDAKRGAVTYGTLTVNRAVSTTTGGYDPDYGAGTAPVIAVGPAEVSVGLVGLSDVGRGYRAFPSDALPGSLSQLADAGAESIGCDTAMIAVPGLAALAAAIGGSRTVEIKPGWCEPSILWGVVVGESSARKSPAFDAATTPLVEVQRRYFHSYREENQQWKDSDKDTRASAPICRRILIDDATLDSVAPVLQQNPRGVLLACEELDAWFQSFVRYSAGGATDQPRWLKLYGGRPLVVDRKTAGFISVPRAVASICGTIQPNILARGLTPAARDSGLASRLLLAWPPRTRMRWSDSFIPLSVTDDYGAVVERLLGMSLDRDEAGEFRPRRLFLTKGAIALFRDHVNAIGERMDDCSEADERAALGKLSGMAARLALVHELAQSLDPANVSEVGSDAMRSAIRLCMWFSEEVLRVYAMLDEPDSARICHELVELIRRKGGVVSIRELQRANGKRYRTTEKAQAALDYLAANNGGYWDPADKSRFVLNGYSCPTSDSPTRPTARPEAC